MPARGSLAIVDEQEITVVALDSGEILSAHRIEPDRATGATREETPADGRPRADLAAGSPAGSLPIPCGCDI